MKRGSGYAPALFCAFLSATVITGCYANASGRAAVRGQADVSRVDFDAGARVTLGGEWQFAWNTPYDPAAATGFLGPAQYLSAPGSWNGETPGGRVLPAYGRGAYRLRVVGAPVGARMALRIWGVGTAYRLYVNGEYLGGRGVVSSNPREARPDIIPAIFTFTPASDVIEIVCDVSNYHDPAGGFWSAPELGLESAVRRHERGLIATDLLLCGALIIMASYHIALFSLRRKDTLILYFGLFCLLVAVRSVFAGERLLPSLIDFDSYALIQRIDYFSWYAAMPMLLMFIARIFPAEFKRAPRRLFQAIAILFGAAVLLLPPRLFAYTKPVYMAITAVAIVYIAYRLALALFRKRAHAPLFMIGVTALVVGVSNDILESAEVRVTGYTNLAPFGLLVFIATQSIFLSIRFASSFKLTEQLSANLEKQNDELRATRDTLEKSERRYRQLVDSANELIFSLSRSGEVIAINQAVRRLLGLRTAAVAGRPVYELLFDGPEAPQGRLFREKVNETIATGGSSSFRADFLTAKEEPLELEVRLDYAAPGELQEAVIFGRASPAAGSVLARYCESELRRFRIGNYVTLADLALEAVTANLERYCDHGVALELRMGVREMLMNAIEHGNLAITSEEKQRAVEEDRFFELLAERQRDPRFRDRHVEIVYSLKNNRAAYLIKDQGEGFDPRQTEPRDSEPRYHGRGIVMTRTVFDVVRYNAPGNAVLLVKRFDARRPGSPAK